MSVWSLEGECDDGKTYAVMVDSVTMTAFGPLMNSAGEVHAFVKWFTDNYRDDPRTRSARELADIFSGWAKDGRVFR